MKYDLIIVGSGFTGSTIAYLAAVKHQMKTLIIEQRKQVSGNMYDEVDKETGILIQKYGPHTFHTNHEEVYSFVTELGKWKPYTLKVGAMIRGKCTPMPFNFETIDMFFSIAQADEIKTALVTEYQYAKKATIVELLQHKNPIIRQYAEFLFENDYKPYSSKQWGISPDELDISVLKRVPVRLSYIDQYFDDKYEMQPIGGYTQFFQKMLNHKNIEIMLETDALDILNIDLKKGQIKLCGELLDIPVVYTGEADRLLKYRYGALPYRSIDFRYQVLETDDYQPRQGIAYPMAEGFTRITEFSKIPFQDGHGKTVIAKEYPVPYSKENGNEPYYPILTKESQEKYARYRTELHRIPNLFVCGRLGDFKYYNMDDAILRAFDIFRNIYQ